MGLFSKIGKALKKVKPGKLLKKVAGGALSVAKFIPGVGTIASLAEGGIKIASGLIKKVGAVKELLGGVSEGAQRAAAVEAASDDPIDSARRRSKIFGIVIGVIGVIVVIVMMVGGAGGSMAASAFGARPARRKPAKRRTKARATPTKAAPVKRRTAVKRPVKRKTVKRRKK